MASLAKKHIDATAPDETPSVQISSTFRAALVKTETCRYCGGSFRTVHAGDAFCSGGHRRMWPYPFV